MIKRLIELQQMVPALKFIRNDATLNLIPGDTALVPQITLWATQLRSTIYELDSILLQQKIILKNFQVNISEITVPLLVLIQFFKISRAAIRQKSWSKEVNHLWESTDYSTQITVLEEIKDSFKINVFLLNRYINNHKIVIGLLLSSIILLYFILLQILNSITKKTICESNP